MMRIVHGTMLTSSESKSVISWKIYDVNCSWYYVDMVRD